MWKTSIKPLKSKKTNCYFTPAMPHAKANQGFVCYDFLKLTSSHIILPYYRLCLVKVLSHLNALILVFVFLHHNIHAKICRKYYVENTNKTIENLKTKLLFHPGNASRES